MRNIGGRPRNHALPVAPVCPIDRCTAYRVMEQWSNPDATLDKDACDGWNLALGDALDRAPPLSSDVDGEGGKLLPRH